MIRVTNKHKSLVGPLPKATDQPTTITFFPMNYKRHYENLVLNASCRKIEPKHTDQHIVMPIGTFINQVGVVVTLTPKENFVANLILYKWYTKTFKFNTYGTIKDEEEKLASGHYLNRLKIKKIVKYFKEVPHFLLTNWENKQAAIISPEGPSGQGIPAPKRKRGRPKKVKELSQKEIKQQIDDNNKKIDMIKQQLKLLK